MTTYVWGGQGATNDFSDAGNWTPGGGPSGATDVAEFDGQDTSVTGDATVGALRFLIAQQVTFGGHLTTAGLAGKPSSFMLGDFAEISFSAGASLAVADTLTVGIFGGSSILDMAGADLTTAKTVIGSGAASEGQLNVDHALWRASGAIVVGQSGRGSLSIGAGATVLAGQRGQHQTPVNVLLGAVAGSNGSLDVSGGGTLVATGNIWIGGQYGAASHGAGQVTIGAQSSIGTSAGRVSVSAGSYVGLSGGGLGGREMNVADGGLIIGSGAVVASDILQNDGEIRAVGQLDIVGTVTGNGVLSIGAGSTLILSDTVAHQSAIAFRGASGRLDLQSHPDIAAPIAGFVRGDTIQVPYVDTISFDQATDKLTLMTGDQVDGTLTFTGDFSGKTFAVQESGPRGLGLITVSATHAA